MIRNRIRDYAAEIILVIALGLSAWAIDFVFNL